MLRLSKDEETKDIDKQGVVLDTGDYAVTSCPICLLEILSEYQERNSRSPYGYTLFALGWLTEEEYEDDTIEAIYHPARFEDEIDYWQREIDSLGRVEIQQTHVDKSWEPLIIRGRAGEAFIVIAECTVKGEEEEQEDEYGDRREYDEQDKYYTKYEMRCLYKIVENRLLEEYWK